MVWSYKVIVTKYHVMMFEKDSPTFTKSKIIIAASPEEAVDKTREDDFWYNEGTGKDYKEIKYPVTFQAENLY